MRGIDDGDLRPRDWRLAEVEAALGVMRVEVTDRDRYGRLVGKMWVGRTYVNAYMAETGNAWAFRRYYNDKAIREGQKAAKAAGRGLWSLPPDQRIPPADWREQHPRTD